MDLTDRLRPYADGHREHSEPMVDIDPIRMFLFRWMIETGDPIEVIAKGFGLETGTVAEILDGRISRLCVADVAHLNRSLSLDRPDPPPMGRGSRGLVSENLGSISESRGQPS